MLRAWLVRKRKKGGEEEEVLPDRKFRSAPLQALLKYRNVGGVAADSMVTTVVRFITIEEGPSTL